MKNSELFTHPGEAIQAWRDQLGTLCKQCPQLCKFVCANNHHECQDKCFQVWLNMEALPRTSMPKPEYHIVLYGQGSISVAYTLKEARKARALLRKKHPDLIIGITGPWYPYKVDGIRGYCLCSSKEGADEMNKKHKERMKS